MSPQKRLLFVFGTRPECIKLAPLILEAEKRSLSVQTCFTGQHQQMAWPILEFFNIKLDHNLQIMKPGQTLNDISLQLFTKLEPVLKANPIDFLVVQGDTTTAAISALMAFQINLDVIHIEAGLRTNNLQSPWPEEFNRRVISLAAKLHFAPTKKSVQNLLSENIRPETIFEVGNTGIDALRLVSEHLARGEFKFKKSDEYLILVTLHRRENFGSEMQALMSGIKQLCEQFPNLKVVWPLHQNPNVKQAFSDVFQKIPKNIILVEPMNYIDFIATMMECDLIVTDSGGVQEEAPFLGKPVLICRNNTERPEAIECGSARLIGTSKVALVAEVTSLYLEKSKYLSMAVPRMPFGDGHASEKIIDVLLR